MTSYIIQHNLRNVSFGNPQASDWLSALIFMIPRRCKEGDWFILFYLKGYIII